MKGLGITSEIPWSRNAGQQRVARWGVMRKYKITPTWGAPQWSAARTGGNIAGTKQSIQWTIHLKICIYWNVCVLICICVSGCIPSVSASSLFSASSASASASSWRRRAAAASQQVEIKIIKILSSFDDKMIPGSEDILDTPYSDTFSCEGQGYGYYADVQSGCQVINGKNWIHFFVNIYL